MWQEIIPSLIKAIVAIAGVIAAYLTAKQTGKAEQKADTAQEQLKTVEKANEVERKVDAMPAADIRKRLFTKWRRS